MAFTRPLFTLHSPCNEALTLMTWAQSDFHKLHFSECFLRTDQSEPTQCPKSAQNSHSGRSIKQNMHPKFRVNFEYVLRNATSLRDCKLNARTANIAPASGVGNPCRTDRTDPISEVGTNFWQQMPKLAHKTLPYGESDTHSRLNSFLWEIAHDETHFLSARQMSSLFHTAALIKMRQNF